MSARLPLLVLGASLLLAALLYLPGLHGPWLLDDFYNLGPFTAHAAGAAPYHDIIFSNPSGPLGRSVAMASFAANHALGLFGTPALKATNVLIHLGNGLLLFALLRALLARRPPPGPLRPDLLAALVAAWWLLLPLHISTVLYIIQRMTELGATFALATTLAYVHGRAALPDRPRRGWPLIALSLGLLFPLALLAKESAATTLPGLVLIELFFFRKGPVRPWLAGLVLATAALIALALLLQPPVLTGGYLGRDFSLGERLLSQPRALAGYLQVLFLPASTQVGLFNDDFAVSRSLLAPAATLPALLALGLLTGLALRLADSPRAWPVAFGIAFFLSGHLVESTVIPLELYFEHRNYLPSAGLLLAAAVPLAQAWDAHRRLLGAALALYLAVLLGSTAHRAWTWGDEGRLLEASARNHPGSIAAVTSYGEYLFGREQPALGLVMVADAARAAPEIAYVLNLQQLSMYCRLHLAPPPRLVYQTAVALAQPRNATLSIRIGLEDVLARKRRGECGATDFRPLAPALVAYDRYLVAHFGASRSATWSTRLVLADWLLELGETPTAVAQLSDAWASGRPAAMPLVGLALARGLAQAGDAAGLRRVLDQLDAVTANAPADFKQQLNRLRAQSQENHD